MAVINWPTGATPGDIYVSPEGDRWVWNGSAWDGISGAANIGPQGPQGAATGPQGSFGPQGPQGTQANQVFSVVIGLLSNNGYCDEAFWFSDSFTDWLGATGATANLTVTSMEVNGVEKIASPQAVEITKDNTLWFNMGGTGGMPYGRASITTYDIGTSKMPVKWLSHLDDLGAPSGVIFSGVTDLTPNMIALTQNVDFEIIVAREAPGLADNDTYWYKKAYSSSTGIATFLYSTVGATGPWVSWSFSSGATATTGSFYK